MIDLPRLKKTNVLDMGTFTEVHHIDPEEYYELVHAVEEAKEIMFDIEQGKDPSFYIKEWLAKYFQDTDEKK